ncbi:DUF7519 family protein [Natronosalvus halobius]|uniref:DUF7519 family protein n=1 Tax=Natronosalvus halobius TaxID=2953746 RepID=UPI0020A067BC|nr:hypothetical protein [Natronosalvus halobius]USZ71857.1 hypothetical protein NGM15_00690 [Natronosalvus halobius]
MKELTRRPTRIASLGAALAAVIVVGATAVGSPAGAVLAVIGTVSLAAGLVWGITDATDAGAGLLFVAVVLSGLQGMPPEVTVVGAIAALVALDLGRSAVELGEQLGRETDTRRLEAVHVVSSLSVGLVAATLGYGVYVFGGGGQPAGGVVLLLLAVVFLVAALK